MPERHSIRAGLPLSGSAFPTGYVSGTLLSRDIARRMFCQSKTGPRTRISGPIPAQSATTGGRGVATPGSASRPRTLAPPEGIAPLAGYTVAVASDRRRHALAGLLEAAGARTVGVQAVRAFSTAEHPAVRDATEAAASAPIDDLLVASDFGFRAWLAAARGWGLAERLVARFGAARLLASNARAADALREIGLSEIWSTAAGSTEELIRYLLAHPQAGRRIVVQSDGVSLAELCHALRAAGAAVVEVATYEHEAPVHADLLRRLGDQVVNRQVDAVAFTATPAVEHLVAQAATDHRRDEVLNALADEVPALCLGELTARPLRAVGVPALTPEQPYLDELVALARAHVPQQAVRLAAAGYRMEVRGQAVVLNDELILVPPGPIAVLRALARNPGRVLSCAEIRRATPNWSAVDDHAIEMAVSRLRRTLHDGELIQTVMRRGYRLAG
jgi:uroporphyrinogen-III synthase